MFLERYNQAFMEIREVIKMVRKEKYRAGKALDALKLRIAKKLKITDLDYKDITEESLIEMKKEIDEKISERNLEITEKENEMKDDDNTEDESIEDDSKENRKKKKKKKRKKDKFWFKDGNDDLNQEH
jgi:hypothetical protein